MDGKLWLVLIGAGVLGLGLLAKLGGGLEASAATSVPKERGEHKLTRTTWEPKGAIETEKAIFAAGCFWGPEYVFRQLPGVYATSVGYSGGHVKSPSYEQVCSDSTGHAEVVMVEFDPETISYDKLLEVFWQIHDPTQVNRQGPDFGSQYRTALFTLNDAQFETATKSLNALATSGKHSRPIATEVTPAGEYWPAEDYHQQYSERTGRHTCPVPDIKL